MTQGCILHDVKAAVFPGKIRQIFGLSARRHAAPFIFFMNPPKLVLSNCTDRLAKADDEASYPVAGHLVAPRVQ